MKRERYGVLKKRVAEESGQGLSFGSVVSTVGWTLIFGCTDRKPGTAMAG